MRFDDMIATVLAQPSDRADQRAAAWRQLADLLAQPRQTTSEEAIESGYAFLREHRSAVELAERRRTAESLAGPRIDPRLLLFFTEDHPQVAAPLIGGARLSSEEWIALLPRLGPTARGLLRHRRDLSPKVLQALSAFGASDMVLEKQGTEPARRPASPAAERSEAQIRELVARIEAYRRNKEERPAPPAEEGPAEEEAAAEGFRWETGPEGIVMWVEGAPRAPLIGQSIATIAGLGQYGVDGQAAGAFEKRAPFRDARFSVPGSGPAAGDWRISGVPYFDPHRGGFLGYRGTARRPRLDEVARGAAEDRGVFGTALPPDSLRQLIHELRTPLNAIIGFAEMIEGQYMGPALQAYRKRAEGIMDQAQRLLSAVDDLDTAARIETSRLDLSDASVDAIALLCRLHDAYEKVASERGSHIAIEIESGLPLARVEQGAAERMFARMLAATIGLAEEDETIGAAMRMEALGGEPMLCLSIDRPRSIASLDEAALLDPGYSPDGDWPGAPALGLGFALRLVRNLAEAVGGALEVGERRFSLYLPPLDPAGRSAGEGGERRG